MAAAALAPLSASHEPKFMALGGHPNALHETRPPRGSAFSARRLSACVSIPREASPAEMLSLVGHEFDLSALSAAARAYSCGATWRSNLVVIESFLEARELESLPVPK